MEKKAKHFPIGHVAGFILSLALTFAAAGIALKTSLPFQTVMWIIGALALMQASIQLFMFMHVNEGEDRIPQIINIVYGLIMAFIIVAGSIWVMYFGNHVH